MVDISYYFMQRLMIISYATLKAYFIEEISELENLLQYNVYSFPISQQNTSTQLLSLS